MLAATENMFEGMHTGFLRQITGKRARKNPDRTWAKPEAGKVLDGSGNAVSGHVHCMQEGDGSTVGGAETYL